MKKYSFFLIVFLLVAFKAEELPNVLIIGDSISLGYTPYLVDELRGKANIIHNEGNAEHTGTGLLKLNDWLGDTDWDVIHFNWGLWDLCYRSEQSKVYGNRDKVNGAVTFTPQEYGENLEKLVLRLLKTKSTLIFATTTYVPDGEAGRFAGDDKTYNRVAIKIMKKYNVKVNKLNKISKKIHKDHKKDDGDVHFTQKGYEILAKHVTKKIIENLPPE